MQMARASAHVRTAASYLGGDPWLPPPLAPDCRRPAARPLLLLATMAAIRRMSVRCSAANGVRCSAGNGVRAHDLLRQATARQQSPVSARTESHRQSMNAAGGLASPMAAPKLQDNRAVAPCWRGGCGLPCSSAKPHTLHCRELVAWTCTRNFALHNRCTNATGETTALWVHARQCKLVSTERVRCEGAMGAG